METAGRNSNPYRPDVALFVVLIPFISAFNYYLTYTNIKFGWFLVLTFTIDTVQGYIAWWAVRTFIIRLDRRWPLQKKPLKRIGVQLIVTIIIGLVIISLLTELTSWIAKGKPAPISFYTIDLFIIGVWFLVVNGIYIGLRYYNEWQRSEAIREEENRIKSDGILVKQGKQELRITFNDIAGFIVEEEYVAVCLLGGNKYLLDQSLDKTEKTIPATFFFRINRQYIVHRQMITGFKRSDNGKLLVQLQSHNNFPSEIQVSRIKAPAFKSWFRPE
jgi:hypothetical protein